LTAEAAAAAAAGRWSRTRRNGGRLGRPIALREARGDGDHGGEKRKVERKPNVKIPRKYKYDTDNEKRYAAYSNNNNNNNNNV